MDNEQYLERRLREYEEFKKRETRFTTQEEFLEFCKHNFVYYPSNYGAYIQTLVTNDQEFIDFAQRVSIDDWYEDSGGLMWFVNDAEDNKYFDFNKETADPKWVVDDEKIEYCPTETVRSFRADYNPYFDDPFSVIEDTPEFYKQIFKPGDLLVKPEIQAKMPFIARFVSHDTFDRMGSIKGHSLEIISLKDVTPGKIMFV